MPEAARHLRSKTRDSRWVPNVDPAHVWQGVVDDVPGLLADFPGPLTPQTNREKLAQLVAGRAKAVGQERWCHQPQVLQVFRLTAHRSMLVVMH